MVASTFGGGRQVPFKSLVPFLVIAFGLAWGVVALLILFTEMITRMFGEISASNPLFILAVYAPAIAAIAVVGYNGGLQGLSRYLSRLLLWRCSLGWYAFLIFGIPLIYFAGSMVKGNLFADPFPFTGLGPMFSAMVFMLILGPVEEFGWRGVALPLLQSRFVPLVAAVILGVIWGFWHLPAFFLSGTPQSAWSFTPFLIGAVSISVIVTPLFNQSGGSILLPALMHFQLNNPIFPDAQPYDTIFFAATALVVVWFNRDDMLSKDRAVVDVIPNHSVQG